jgi:hypothetical protein
MTAPGELGGPPVRDESEAERLDRQLAELLQELRIALPGVQVLFAFLLTVPFSARFDSTTETQRGIYLGVLLATALATSLLLAPTSLHRLRFRQGRKRGIVELSHRLTIAGLVVLAFAVTGAVFLVTDVTFTRWAAWVAASGTFAVTATLWWVIPLTGRRETEDET